MVGSKRTGFLSEVETPKTLLCVKQQVGISHPTISERLLPRDSTTVR